MLVSFPGCSSSIYQLQRSECSGESQLRYLHRTFPRLFLARMAQQRLCSVWCSDECMDRQLSTFASCLFFMSFKTCIYAELGFLRVLEMSFHWLGTFHIPLSRVQRWETKHERGISPTVFSTSYRYILPVRQVYVLQKSSARRKLS